MSSLGHCHGSSTKLIGPDRVGSIVSNLGLTCGGDWARSIDRPHFEVKRNWKMPRGYRLEGQVIVQSNSKMKDHLINCERQARGGYGG